MLNFLYTKNTHQNHDYGEEIKLMNKENFPLDICYIDPNFGRDKLFDLGFGLCENYTHDENNNSLAAYELFIRIAHFGSARIYLTEDFSRLDLEDMGGNGEWLLELFLQDMVDLGLLFERTTNKKNTLKKIIVKRG